MTNLNESSNSRKKIDNVFHRMNNAIEAKHSQTQKWGLSYLENSILYLSKQISKFLDSSAAWAITRMKWICASFHLHYIYCHAVWIVLDHFHLIVVFRLEWSSWYLSIVIKIEQYLKESHLSFARYILEFTFQYLEYVMLYSVRGTVNN